MRDVEAEITRITSELGDKFPNSSTKDDVIKCLIEAYTDTMLALLYILEREAPAVGCRTYASNYSMYLSMAKELNEYNGT